jgi:hypothetical protein
MTLLSINFIGGYDRGDIPIYVLRAVWAILEKLRLAALRVCRRCKFYRGEYYRVHRKCVSWDTMKLAMRTGRLSEQPVHLRVTKRGGYGLHMPVMNLIGDYTFITS